MDNEFLELIRTFEKSAKRLEQLDCTISGFKDVAQDLRSNLDEVVEMVALEEITQLSQMAVSRLKGLQSQMDALHDTHQVLDRAIQKQEALQQPAPDLAASGEWVYQIHKQEVLASSPDQAPHPMETAVKFKELKWFQGEVFALPADGSGIGLLKDGKLSWIYQGPVEDFLVEHFDLLILSGGQLLKYSVLTRSSQVLQEGVSRMELLSGGSRLLVERSLGRWEAIRL